ncbi:MAG: electron transfer flavoprotein subunit beta/FixA family protein [Telmatospirillum sp.]|nr:electron transfer flavoprotein subunit beta/FixA family protein [Telmatospirillum sp.]
MKRVIVCYKWVPDGADIRIDERTRTLAMDGVSWTLNDFDRNAIEAGVQIKAATGCDLIGVTAGVDTEASGKDALSRGLDSLYYLSDQAMADADSRTTSEVLAGMIGRLGGADLVICSEASDDEYAQQTGPRLAALLGYSSVTCVSALSPSGESLSASRKLEEGVEDVEIAGPAVVSVVPDINQPPFPSVKQILGAKKKPSQAVALAEVVGDMDRIRPQLRTDSLLAPEVSRKRVSLSAGGVGAADAVAGLLKALAAEGVL